MTNNQDPAAAAGNASEDFVTLKVEVRREHVPLLRRFASREGASVEALAGLWLEEKLDEAIRSSRPSQIKGESSGSE